MSNTPSILPPNATAIERHIEQTTARIENVPIDFAKLLNPHTCPLTHLPWLAWAMSVDEWDNTWEEQIKRDVIASSIAIHRHKGTPGAIKKALQALGYNDVQIIEPKTYKYDGQHRYDGLITYGTDLHWAEFDVHLNAGELPPAELEEKIRRSISNYKPTRSHLRNLKYATKLYNGQHSYDGSITYDGGFLNE